MSGRPRIGLATLALLAPLASAGWTGPASAAAKVRMSGTELLIPQLAIGLGAFAQEGIEVIPVKVEDVAAHDYLDAEALNKGQLDASVWWFHHVLFGAGNDAPTQAVVLLGDTPGMMVMVANRARDSIKSAADFRGKKVAEGAGYSAKSYLTRYLATRAGLAPGSYTPVAVESGGRKEAVLKGLREGQVDVMTFNEPMASTILATGMVTPLYDLTTKEGTRKALGDLFPTQCLFMTPGYIKANPETAQRLVNAFVRAMRYANTHSAEQIAAKLPAGYFKNRTRQAAIDEIQKAMPTVAKGDYSFSPSAVGLVAEAVFTSTFDDSDEGRYRANAKRAKASIAQSYTNRFVEKAMKEIQ
jgi:NitT/TauT family transport system substrate-binding protein